MRVHLISPHPDHDRQAATEMGIIGIKAPFAVNAAAGIATVAAFFPPRADVTLCDEIISPTDPGVQADLIGISVNVSQIGRAIAPARACRARGLRAVIGGPHVSLAPEAFAGEADHLVIGEFEDIAPRFMEDLAVGALRPRYQGGKPDLALSPAPRWDLYPNDRALSGVVQTSRGCPFECAFCDVIQHLGRKQRHKPIANVLAEMQTLHDLGHRAILLSDDNFTVHRRRARELREALASWKGGKGRAPVRFSTQVSIDAARDPDLLSLANRAGLCHVFVGQLPVLKFNVAALVAPIATPLHARMAAAGRLVGGGGAGNIIPLQMTGVELAEGRAWLKRALLAPEAAMQRFARMAELLGPPAQIMQDAATRRPHPMHDLIALLRRDRGARRMIEGVRGLVADLPEIGHELLSALTMWMNEDARDAGMASAAPRVVEGAAA